ncbi:50S ribosomal protein L6 [Dehalococcoidia bacterium]|nr:50S ribosomal protein L6 [Dehalococcoidia bacterium]
MSRVGKKPIPIPNGVSVDIKGTTVTTSGPKGELSRTVAEILKVEHQDNELIVTRPNDEKRSKAMHGLTRSLINNMVVGVSEGYQRSLEIVGVGYRATQQGGGISLQVGYSGPIDISPLPGVELEVEGQNRIHVRGTQKELVGQMAAQIRKIRPPDRYKGKGVRYVGETVQLKPGKGGRKA